MNISTHAREAAEWKRSGMYYEKRSDEMACQRAINAATATVEKDIACDVCGGSGTPVSGRKCVCDGTGKASQAAHNFRLQLYDATADRDRLAAELAAAKAVVEAAFRDAKEGE